MALALRATLAPDADIALSPDARSVFRPLESTSGAYWCQQDDGIVLASDVADLGVELRPRADRLATFLALEPWAHESAWFEGVSELQVGCRLSVGAGSVVVRAEQSLVTAAKQRSLPSFTEHVERALRPPAQQPRAASAIMLSAGVDSSLIAALWQPALALSWRLGLPEADEHDLAAKHAQAMGIEHRVVDGARLLPGRLADFRQLQMASPQLNIYCGLRSAVAKACAEAGIKNLLSGDFADHLHLRHSAALRSAIRTGRWQQAARLGWQRWQASRVQAAAPTRNWLHRRWRAPDRAINTPDRAGAFHPELVRWLSEANHDLSVHAHPHYPYRNPAVVALFDGAPAHWLNDGRHYKPSLLAILRQRVPSYREPHPKPTLAPWFRRAFQNWQRGEQCERLLEDARLHDFLDRHWLVSCLRDGYTSQREAAVLWRALCTSHWLDRLTEPRRSGSTTGSPS